jgi:hypothetical protein
LFGLVIWRRALSGIISMFDVATSGCKKILNGGFDLFMGRFI